MKIINFIMSELFNKKKKLLNVRAKLMSLKSLKKNYDENEEMHHIEKSLEKENKMDDSDMEKNPMIPNDEIEVEI